MRPLVIRPAASRDVDDAATWYEQRRDGLGLRFLGEVDRIFRRIEDGPLQYPMVEEEVRRALLRKFPYTVYFIEEPAQIVVLAVLHCSRHPDVWRSRS